MKRIGRLNAQGFTIVELLVSMIVGAVIVGALSVITINNTHLSQRGRDVVLANAFAEAKVEALRSAGYVSLTDGTTNITAELPSDLKAPRSGSQVVTSPSTGLKKIVLNITYNDQGESRTYSYSTMIGELGVGQN
jgi:prepilin-type N-terminal cleavage/methylation domain-containing protein